MTDTPTAREVLTMVADWNAAEREAEEARALCNDHVASTAEMRGEKLCRQLLRLKPAHLRALAAPSPAPAPADAELTTDQAMKNIRARMEGMGYTSPLWGALSLIATSARFAQKTVDSPGKYEALCREIAVTVSAAQRLNIMAAPANATHLKTGNVYTLIGPAKHKALGERWIDTVWYQNDAGERFSRETANFYQAFALAPAAAERDGG